MSDLPRPSIVALLRWELATRVLVAGTLVLAIALVGDLSGSATVSALACAAAASLPDLGRGLRNGRLQVVAALLGPCAIAAGAAISGRTALTALAFGLALVAATALTRAGVVPYLVGLTVVMALLVGTSVGRAPGTIWGTVLAGLAGSTLALGLSAVGTRLPLPRALALPPGAAARLAGSATPAAALADLGRLREPTTLYALAVGAAGGVSWLVADGLVEKPEWVMFAAIAAIAPARAAGAGTARRVVGANVAGLALIGVLFLLGLPLWAVALAVVVAFAVGLLIVVVSPQLFRTLVVPFSILIASGTLGLGGAVEERLVDVLLGVGIGALAGLVLHAVAERIGASPAAG